MNMDQTKKVNCRKCKFYYMTWETKHPHGCRAMNFKGKEMPSITVLRNSGANCLLFQAKPGRPLIKK